MNTFQTHTTPHEQCWRCCPTPTAFHTISLLRLANIQSYKFKSAHNAPECQLPYIVQEDGLCTQKGQRLVKRRQGEQAVPLVVTVYVYDIYVK